MIKHFQAALSISSNTKTPQLTPRGFALLQIQLRIPYPLLNTLLNSFCTGGMAATTTHSSVSTPIEKKL